jgi:hypothetical protein
LSDSRRADRAALVLPIQFVADQHRHDLVFVLLVQVHDLQFGHQQLSERDRARVDVQPVGDWQAVTHLESADEHVELPLVSEVVEELTAMDVEGIELGVGVVAEPLSERRELA